MLYLMYQNNSSVALDYILYKQNEEEKNHILRFCPTFTCRSSMLNEVKSTKICCNLFWILLEFDWTIDVFSPGVIFSKSK